MKKYFLYLLTLLIFLGTGCTKKWLDVNTDPNNPSQANAELVLPAGIVSVAATTGDYYSNVAGFWMQYWSQSNAANQFKDIDMYNINPDDVSSSWNELYAGGLNDLQYVIDTAKAHQDNALLLVATVMQAYGFAFLVDFHDNIPYFEAFKGTAGNLNPKYDDGHDVYIDLFKRLDSVKALDVSMVSDALKKSDLVFKGDMAQWVKFANTLELRMYLRMVNKYPAEAQAGVEALYTAGANFLAGDAKLDIFVDQENQDNPLFASNVRKLNVATNLRVSATIFFYFAGNSDPRLATILRTEDVALTRPMPQGGFNITQANLDKDDVPTFKMSPTDPIYFISNVESYLLQAEAIMRGWGGSLGEDKTFYDMAVQADFTRRGVGSAATFTGTGGAYEYPATGTYDQKLEAIIMAKWAAFAGNQNAESFFEFNRTGYPVISNEPMWKNNDYNPLYTGGLTYSLEGITSGEFPHRLVYPKSEADYNTNFPGQTTVIQKVWWAKN